MKYLLPFLNHYFRRKKNFLMPLNFNLLLDVRYYHILLILFLKNSKLNCL